MRFSEELIPARMIRRSQRFLADVRLADGSEFTVHCPNSGSMLGCVEAGGPVLLSVAANSARGQGLRPQPVSL